MLKLITDTQIFHLHFRLEKVPVDGEDFENIMRDFKQHVVPRMAYWGHPQFAAYYPGGSSPASILGDLLCAGVNQLGFSWVFDFFFLRNTEKFNGYIFDAIRPIVRGIIFVNRKIFFQKLIKNFSQISFHFFQSESIASAY